jgi:simple sugar transport system permease protein
MSANTCPGPTEGNWSISPTINSAALSIRVERITWGVYVLAGILAALGGLAITGYVGAISANQGNGLIFTVFAAAVIGGISLDGGKGTMFGR